MDQHQTYHLVEQFLEGRLSAGEQQEFYRILQDPVENKGLLAALETLTGDVYASDKIDARMLDLMQKASSIDRTEELAVPAISRSGAVHRLRTWGWVAACVLFIVCAGAYFMMQHSQHDATAGASAQQASTFAPGKDGAILTLANGQQVVLDSMANGIVASQNGSRAVLKNGQLTYDLTGAKPVETAYNTISTPKGRQFHMRLPDGSDVWLNAASSITFPTVFAGSERKVEVSGEAYFEVIRDVKKPFRVVVPGKQQIDVLGTHFNVNAYETENALSTTLLEGSVRISSFSIKADNSTGKNGSQKQTSIVLQPGQQGKWNGDLKLVNNIDTDKIMAWKNGLFNFEGVGLHDMMHQMERWYDIRIVFEGNVQDIEFGGEMSRNVPLSEVLHALENYGVHFKLEEQGRTLKVLP